MNILLFIMLAVFPLFSVNHYFNLTLAKYWFYSVVALAIFLWVYMAPFVRVLIRIIK